MAVGPGHPAGWPEPLLLLSGMPSGLQSYGCILFLPSGADAILT